MEVERKVGSGQRGPTTDCGVGWECRVLAVSRKGRQANRKGAGAECCLLGWGMR